MRPLLVPLHRWFGIATALFLFVAGLTGAVIAWDHELDAMLNPSFFHARTDGPPLPSLEVARRIEADDPRLQVTYLPLAAEPGHTLQVMVWPRVDPHTQQPYKLDFNQLAVDPATGAIQGRREWGAVSLARLNLIPFLYKLHYTLHLPFTRGVDVGTWLMGIVGIVWIFDSMIALALSFPNFNAWRKSFVFRVKRGGYPLTFDLHRSGGVWIWGLLLMMAVTSVSMNLANEVVRPIVSRLSPLTATPFSDSTLAGTPHPGKANLSRERILDDARRIAEEKHLSAPPGALFYATTLHTYGVGFFTAGNDHGDGPLGNAWLYLNAQTGRPVGETIPGEGSAGDIFMQAQFPLHSGRIAGLGGRIVISALGLAVAVLSVTGLMIWLKKLAARRRKIRAPRKAPRTAQAGKQTAERAEPANRTHHAERVEPTATPR
ncbi:PepSY-associated TM helix domain-containing protein [Paraburkholderia rhizosphaerae]|uniref:Putative iron-regulated membrane protein n=1 Tax=Paraburkholderia rhizosphaerae TaxID=480658 RepID=A0A4R8LYS5_9BURK|nr:PepSY-associated TM helix domain-containing protein [Paraburkholderia rhizosphaerae]TDY53428.1 putative iron-regulated membrane protein [Paraburkholderia rhizosphaerae]